MGFSKDYSHVPDWVKKPQGYKTGEMVKYKGNVFIAKFWADKPGEGDPNENGWRLHDELYDVTSSPAAKPAKIIGYIPTWRKKEGFDYANVEMYRHVTHGIVSFLMFSETDLGEFERKSVDDVDAIISDVVQTGHDCGTYISIALGGAVDYGFLSLMEHIGKNPDAPVLQKAVKNVVDFVKKNGLDGVDLDLECWWDKNNDPNKDRGGRLKSDGAHPAGKGLTEFAKQLKQAMPDKIISAALFATSWYGNCYDPKLVEYVDWLGLMTYDLTGSWNQSPVGPQTALLKIRKQEKYADEQQGEWPSNRSSSANTSDPMSDNPILSVEDSLWYWTNPFFTNWQGKGQNLKRNKIAAGVPIYGYDFAYGKEPDDLSGQIAPGYKNIRYKDILSQFPDAPTAANANIKVPGNTPRPPFVSAPGTYPYAHNIYFETPESATDKLKFLKSVGAQGAIIWELSNDVWKEGKSIIKELYKNSGNPAVRPPIGSGGQRYNQCSFLCTHNAFCNYEDSRWTNPNQYYSITHQLERGVRALMLDAHYAEPSALDVFEVIPEEGVYLLHGVNEHGWIGGITYALPSRRLSDALDNVWGFLNDNPKEVVTIFLEDYTTAEQLKAEFDFILNKDEGGRDGKKFLQLIYNPEKDPNWKVKEKKQWPRLSDLIAWNKRLIIFSSFDNNPQHESDYVAWNQDYTKENYWSLGDLGNDLNCPSRWDDGDYIDADYPKLFVFNHFRNAPTVGTAALDNAYKKIVDRINNECCPLAKQLPNFIAVDFFEVPLGKAQAKNVVDYLNERLQNNEGCPKD